MVIVSSYVQYCIEQKELYCRNNSIPLDIVQVDTMAKAKAVPSLFNNWAVFYNGKFETVHLMNEGYFNKM